MIAMLRRTIRPFAMAASMGTSLLLLAQVPLQPQWIHTWPYGADQLSLMAYAPAWQDNHVVVDPITGLVHATVSDENMLYSPRFELLHTFASDGTDLTGAGPIVLGPTPFAELYDTEFNGSSVTGLMINDGRLFAGLTYMMGEPNFGISWGNHFEGGAPTGERWRITTNADYYSPQTLSPTTDGNLVLLHSTGASVIYAHDIAGWFQWRVELPGATFNIGIENGVAYARTGTTMQRIDLNSGTLLPEVPLGSSEERFVVKNGAIYTATATFEGSVRLRKRTMDGAIVWEHLFQVGEEAFLSGLVVDDADGTWATASAYNYMEENMVGGILMGVDASGSALPTRIYGDAFHSLATNGSMLYMTGWSDNSGTETFLIGVDIALITDVQDGADMAQATQVWPVPANDVLNVGFPENTQQLELVDALGRSVAHWSVYAHGTQVTIEVSAIANGRYTLLTRGQEGQGSIAVVIAR